MWLLWMAMQFPFCVKARFSSHNNRWHASQYSGDAITRVLQSSCVITRATMVPAYASWRLPCHTEYQTIVGITQLCIQAIANVPPHQASTRTAYHRWHHHTTVTTFNISQSSSYQPFKSTYSVLTLPSIYSKDLYTHWERTGKTTHICNNTRPA